MKMLQGLLIALIAGLGLSPGAAHAVSITLFTADVDDTQGENPIGVPADSNPNIPSISPGVTLGPGSAPLDGVATGPLNGITYGPGAFGGNTGGSTGFVTSSFTFDVADTYQLVWEVADVSDTSTTSAFAIDNVTLNGSELYNFESGIPGGFTVRGTVGTSGAVTNLAPTQGNSFAFLDTTGNAIPAFDTVTGTEASRLISSPFTVRSGDVLSVDLAFLTQDGDAFQDYAIAAVTNDPVPDPVPEPLTILGSGMALGFGALMKRQHSRKRQKI